MLVRRTLAAALTAGALLLAAGCAGDDLASDDASDPTESSAAADKGSVTHRRPELPGGDPGRLDVQAAPGERRLHRRHQAGRLARRLHADLPRQRRRRPRVRRRHRQLPQHPGERRDAEPFETGDGQELADAGADLLDAAGITLLDVSPATDTNAFFVTKESQRGRGRHQALRPRGHVRHPGRRPRLRGSPRLRGRPLRRVRHRRHRGAAAGLRQRPDLPVRPRRRVGARRDQHHRRHARVAGPRRPRGRPGDPAGAEPRAGRRVRLPGRATRTSPTSSTR